MLGNNLFPKETCCFSQKFKAFQNHNKPMETKKLAIAVILLVIGIVLVFYAFSQQCEIPAIKTPAIAGQPEQTIFEFPKELQMMLCISSNPVSMISMAIGLALVFSAAARVANIVTK